MSILRNEVKEAERDPSTVGRILGRCSDVCGFINLYLKRNPSRKHPEFLEFYNELNIPSQVLLYEEKREMIRSDEFEHECIMQYCIEQRSELSYGIIRNVKNSKILFQRLTMRFLSSIDLEAEDDFFFTRCIVLALRTHEIEPNEMDALIAGIGNHFSDGRRKYYEHGAIVASVLVNTSDFNVASMEEAQRMIEDIPESILKGRDKCGFLNPNDAFSCYKRVENDLSVIRSSWRPKYLQEGIRIIAEEKDIGKIEIIFRCFSNLVDSATDRILRSRGREAFDVLINYDGCEEHKVDAISSLLQRSFNFLIGEVLDDFFNKKLCLRHKLILAFSLKRIAEKGPYDQVVSLHRSMRFMLRRTREDIPTILRNSIELLLSESLRRTVVSNELVGTMDGSQIIEAE